MCWATRRASRWATRRSPHWATCQMPAGRPRPVRRICRPRGELAQALVRKRARTRVAVIDIHLEAVALVVAARRVISFAFLSVVLNNCIGQPELCRRRCTISRCCYVCQAATRGSELIAWAGPPSLPRSARKCKRVEGWGRWHPGGHGQRAACGQQLSSCARQPRLCNQDFTVCCAMSAAVDFRAGGGCRGEWTREYCSNIPVRLCLLKL